LTCQLTSVRKADPKKTFSTTSNPEKNSEEKTTTPNNDSRINVVFDIDDIKSPVANCMSEELRESGILLSPEKSLVLAVFRVK